MTKRRSFFKVIEEVKTNIVFSSHSIERLDREGLKQSELSIEEVLYGIEYHKDENGDNLVWAVQDFLSIKDTKDVSIVVVDNISLVINVFFDYYDKELTITIVTIWNGRDIRRDSSENIIYMKKEA